MPDTAGESLGSARPGLPEQRNDRRRRLILAACLIATFMAAVESTIVATIIPTIVSDLGGFDLFTWVFTVYLLTQAVTIPVYGRLADLFGRKPVFFFGTAVFLIGTVLCGMAWNMPSLVCFRALQGCGAGAIQPIAATISGRHLYAGGTRPHSGAGCLGIWRVGGGRAVARRVPRAAHRLASGLLGQRAGRARLPSS